MPCYAPLKAWLPPAGEVNPKTGDGRPLFSYEPGLISRGWQEIQVPCGQCIGCRLEKARQWACRCMHEASLYDNNCFITLTFSDKYLNPDMSLHKEDFVNFMKRFRKFVSGSSASGIRFFHSGEYGDLNLRPHHHAIIFNYDFPDKYLWETRRGIRYYRSDILEKLWPYGNIRIGNVTFESCGYVARYVLKKITGKDSRDYYGNRILPYVTMSRRPGIGLEWLKKYVRDVYPNDFIVVRNGIRCKPPRYYDDMYNYLQAYIGREDLVELDTIDDIKKRRKDRAIEQKARLYENEYEEYERLMVKEYIKEKRIESLKRGL